jgi:hypothetical protein
MVLPLSVWTNRLGSLLGTAKRLFADNSEPRAFKLTHGAVSPSGVIHATYVRDGEVQTALSAAPRNLRGRSWRAARG